MHPINIATSLLFLLAIINESPLADDRQPNVVLVLTDDQGFGDMRSHGNPLIDTPTHDRIAEEGARH